MDEKKNVESTPVEKNFEETQKEVESKAIEAHNNIVEFFKDHGKKILAGTCLAGTAIAGFVLGRSSVLGFGSDAGADDNFDSAMDEDTSDDDDEEEEDSDDSDSEEDDE